jgi:hypothetical protein
MLDAGGSALLKLITVAPASTHSVIAIASSSGVVLGNSLLPGEPSAKIGRTKMAQLGQIAGADEFLTEHKMPATKVPCTQAVLVGSTQEARNFPGKERMFAVDRSGWSRATGPSINPIFTSGLPLERFINCASFTSSKGSMMFRAPFR